MTGPTLTRAGGARWSVLVVDVATGEPLLAVDPDVLLPSASLGKLFLLVEVAERVVDGTLDPARPLDRRGLEPVADSGLWRHLGTDVLPVADAATLAGTVSDNLATNALLDVVGLDAVQRRAALLAPGGSTLLDRVRDRRGPTDPPCLSRSSAADLATVFAALNRGDLVQREVADLVLGWLANGVDHSLASAAFHLDPLAHDVADLGLRVWSKTGADPGVRGEAGLVHGSHRTVAFAALSAWDPSADAALRAAVLTGLRAVGETVRSAASAPRR